MAFDEIGFNWRLRLSYIAYPGSTPSAFTLLFCSSFNLAVTMATEVKIVFGRPCKFVFRRLFRGARYL